MYLLRSTDCSGPQIEKYLHTMFEIQKVTYKNYEKKNAKNLGYMLKEVLIAAARKLRGARRIWRNSR